MVIYTSKGMSKVVIRQCGTAKDIQNIETVFLEVIDLDSSKDNVMES